MMTLKDIANKRTDDYIHLKELIKDRMLLSAVYLAKSIGLKADSSVSLGSVTDDYHYSITTADGYVLLEAAYSTGWAGWYQFDGILVPTEERIN